MSVGNNQRHDVMRTVERSLAAVEKKTERAPGAQGSWLCMVVQIYCPTITTPPNLYARDLRTRLPLIGYTLNLNSTTSPSAMT